MGADDLSFTPPTPALGVLFGRRPLPKKAPGAVPLPTKVSLSTTLASFVESGTAENRRTQAPGRRRELPRRGGAKGRHKTRQGLQNSESELGLDALERGRTLAQRHCSHSGIGLVASGRGIVHRNAAPARSRIGRAPSASSADLRVKVASGEFSAMGLKASHR